MSDLEQGILGGLIVHTDTIPELASTLKPRDFYKPEHQIIWKNLHECHIELTVFDPTLFIDFLIRHNQLDACGGPLYIMDLAAIHSSHPRSIFKYVKLIQEQSDKRAFRTMGQEIAEEALRADVTAEHLYSKMSASLSELSSERSSEGFTTAGDLLPQVDADLKGAMALGKSYGGLDTGFDKLNTTLNGFCGSELTVIGARPSIGKTTLALQFMRVAALHSKVPVCFFSLEMSGKQLMQRLLCIEAGLNVSRFRRGLMEKWELETYEQAAFEMSTWPIYIDDTPGLTIPQMKGRMLKMKRAFDIKLWLIDYLQLMVGEGENENQQVNSISKGLKSLTKIHDEPIVCLSQLNRSVEARTDKKPQLADMRGSGGIEQDADSCLLLYRPGFYPYLRSNWKGKHNVDTYAELIAEKTRFGPTGIIPLQWVPERAEFKNG